MKTPSEQVLAPVGDMIVASRLLVLQSKRMLLISAQGRLRSERNEKHRTRVERLEGDVRKAHQSYNEAVLRWSLPHTPQYRLVAYSSLIAKAERLRAALSAANGTLSHADRAEVVADLRNLDAIIASWRSVARASMGAAVA